MVEYFPLSNANKSVLVKPASGDCNLHCTYCFYHERPTDPYRTSTRRRMSREVLDALIQQGMRLNRHHASFGWQGGEPTLCGLDFFREVVALQKRYGAAGQSVSNGLQTNGLLLDAEWARFLREYNFLVGISLDGPEPYHDAYRQYVSGAGSHHRVMEVLRLLKREGVAFNILSVVNRITGQHGAEIYDYLVEEGFTYLQFIPCVEIDPQTGQVAEFSVRPEDFGDFLCEVFDKWYNGGHPEVSVRDFDAFLAMYLGQEAPMCCYQPQCGGYLVVEYNGDLYPCDFMVREDLYLGNILETSLDQAFAGERLRRFALEKAKPRPECTACAWLPLCHQGCQRLVGVAGNPRHYLCRAYQQFFAHSYTGFMTLRNRWLAEHAPQISPKTLPIPVQPVGRNAPCPCGSGKKFKHCCALKNPPWYKD